MKSDMQSIKNVQNVTSQNILCVNNNHFPKYYVTITLKCFHQISSWYKMFLIDD